MRFLVWRGRHIKEKTLVIILSLVVGLLAGLAAIVLKWLIHMIGGTLTAHVNVNEGNYLFIVYPVVGVLLACWYVRYVVRDNISHGVTRVLYAISQNKSRLKPHNMYTSVVASSITIGFGGSVGAEGPIVFTGAAIGSNLGQAFRLSPRVLMILVGCGAAAGIAGIFKAPIAGMLFTLEVLMLDLTTVTVMPLLIASITAASVAYVFTGYNLEFFSCRANRLSRGVSRLYRAGGVLRSRLLIFTKVMMMMESFFKRDSRLSGARLFSGEWFLPDWSSFPASLRRGLRINQLSAQRRPFQYRRRLDFLRRPPQRGIHHTIYRADYRLQRLRHFRHQWSRRRGRHFCALALCRLYDRLLLRISAKYPFPGLDLSVKNFALMGMAGVMSGVMHAPLMGIFLTAEMTGGYQLFLPLLIVSTLSYGTIRIFEPYSIYTMRLARRGELLTHHKDKAVLTLLK